MIIITLQQNDILVMCCEVLKVTSSCVIYTNSAEIILKKKKWKKFSQPCDYQHFLHIDFTFDFQLMKSGRCLRHQGSAPGPHWGAGVYQPRAYIFVLILHY